jgi:hypothetical protein
VFRVDSVSGEPIHRGGLVVREFEWILCPVNRYTEREWSLVIVGTKGARLYWRLVSLGCTMVVASKCTYLFSYFPTCSLSPEFVSCS